MKVAIGADHRGYRLKEALKVYLSGQGIEVLDVGTDSEESTHYPLYAKAVAEKVKSGEAEYGVLICYTGIGMSIAANKIPGIRAALATTPELVELARRHNNANILCLPGGFIEPEKAQQLVDLFLRTGFDGGRHAYRIGLIQDLESCE